jgi:hypothetical protein
MALTLHVPETPDACDTVADAYGRKTEIKLVWRSWKNDRNILRTRPVSSTLLPTEEPAIRDSRMEDTSDAADMTCHNTDNGKSTEGNKSAGCMRNNTTIRRTRLRSSI